MKQQNNKEKEKIMKPIIISKETQMQSLDRIPKLTNELKKMMRERNKNQARLDEVNNKIQGLQAQLQVAINVGKL